MNKTMKKNDKNRTEKIRQAIETYGSNLRLWPEDTAKEAEKHITETPELQKLLHTAQQEDAYLRTYRIETPSMDTLEKRILAEARATAQQTGHAQPVAPKTRSEFWKKFLPLPALRPAHVFAPAGGLLTAALFGFWLGFSGIAAPDGNGGLLLDAVYYQVMAEQSWNDTILIYATEGETL